MAQMKSGFLTGAKAKIKAYDKTIAYCTDVAYNVAVQTIPIESMGRYEVHSNEPVAYTVDGSFSVIRYTKNATDSQISQVAKDKGNAPESMENGNGKTLHGHINPAEILQSETFDLDIFEKNDNGDDIHVYRVRDCRLNRRGMTLNKRGVMVDNYAFVGVIGTDKDIGEDNEAAESSFDTDTE